MKPWLHRLLALGKKLRSLRHKDSFEAMSPCDLILCCADSDRTEDYEGKAYSRVLDSLAQELEQDSLKIHRFAWPYSCTVGSKAWGYAYSANRRFFGMALWKKVSLALGRQEDTERLVLDVYDRIFARTGARAVVGVGLPPAAIQAARKRGIRSVEVLHGYGYASLPWGWATAPRDCLPDSILAFDALSARTFGGLAPQGIEVSRIESPWHRKFRADRPSTTLPHSWQQELQWIPKGKKVVLVSTSWGYDGDHGPYGFFAGILVNGLFPEELLSAIESAGDEYHWLFRLHPVQLSDYRHGRYRKILSQVSRRFANFEWQHASRTPLPLVLQRCHAHISMISMTAYDAAFMGLKSLMLCPTLKPGGPNELMFSDLKEQGYVQLGGFNGAAMVSWLKAAGPVGDPPSSAGMAHAHELKSLLLPPEVKKT